MTREQYISAVNALIEHNRICGRIREVSRDLAREVGDDFGGLALIPRTLLRAAFIGVVQQAIGDKECSTKYLFDECISKKGGGYVLLHGAVKLAMVDAETCRIAIQAMTKASQ